MAPSIIARMFALALALGTLAAAPVAAQAPQLSGRVYRVGMLAMGSRTPDGRPGAALRDGLRAYARSRNEDAI